jgi:hypothetical protein
MGALRDLLEVYGALDEAAGKSADPSVAEVLDDFLPRSSANTGWYREVESFFFGHDAKQTPSLVDACKRLGERAEQAEQAEDSGAKPLSAPQKQRLFYGLTAAARIQQVAPTPMLPPVSDIKEALLPGLVAVGPEGMTCQERSDNADTHFDTFLDHARSAQRSTFPGMRTTSAGMNIVDPATQQIPLCRAALVTVNGLQCAVIDTDLSSDAISLKDLKAIVNPFNWHENYPDFFIRMAPFRDPVGSGGWRHVLETVGFAGLGAFEITTALRYYPTGQESDACVARLDYDLAEPTPGPGDGQVLVDRGYINMWSTAGDAGQKGVRVRTRKVIHISGLSPYAQQRLVCLTGYGTASSEFLFGPATDPDPDAQPFHYYTHGQPPEEETETSDSEPSTHVVAAAVNLWTDAVSGVANDYFDMAEKWMAGGLRLTDVTDFSQKLTGRLMSSPLEFLDRVSQPRYPRGRPTETPQDGNP